MSGVLTVALARGNVIGRVTASDGTTPVRNALVTATNTQDATDVSVTCTSESGDFGFVLKPGNTYKIKIFPVNKSGLAYADKLDLSEITVLNGSNPSILASLALK